MKTYVMLLLIAGSLPACQKSTETSTTQTTGATVHAPNAGQVGAPHPVTPFDQGTDPADIDTTRAIRNAVNSDDALSVGARNVMIVTHDGVITLRGTVQSDEEERNILAKAEACAGENRVDDQLEVASPR